MKRQTIILCTIALVCGGRAGWLHFGPGAGAGRRGCGWARRRRQHRTTSSGRRASCCRARWAGLSPATGGTVKALYPAEGDKVEDRRVAGRDLDNGILQSQVEVAAAAVAEAEAARSKLVAGATPTELAAAQADVERSAGGGRTGAGHRQARPGSRRRGRGAGDHRPGAVQ